MAGILLADDDKSTCALLERAFKNDGHTVTVAADGQEALDLFMADPSRFALIVSDLQMPLLTGVALVEAAMAAKPTVKAILMSGLADELARAARLQAAGVVLVAKPFSLDAIRAEARKLTA